MLFRPPVSRTFAMTPAVGAAAFVLGAGLVWAESVLRRRAQEHEDWLNQNRPTDALNRKLDLTRLNNGQLEQVRRLLQGKKDGIYQDPLTGVTVTGADLGAELLRRSGQGGFLFVPPVVAGPAVSALANGLRFAAVGAVAWLVARLGLDWGAANSSGPQFGPPQVKPAWWPTGSEDPSGLNSVVIELETVTQRPENNCAISSFVHNHYGAGGYGVSRYWVKEGNPSGAQNPCGGWDAPSTEVMVRDSRGHEHSVLSDSSGSGVIALNILSIRVMPAGEGVAGVVMPDWRPNPQPQPDRRIKPVPVQPQPETIPLPLPEPLPAEVPGSVPAEVPGTANPGQITKAPPKIGAPGRPAQRPVKVPGAVDVGPGSIPAPAPIPLPPTTPAGEIIPWPGAGPIGSPGQGPRPDLVGIAAEVGKIERKLEIMNRLPNPLNGPLDPSDLNGIAKFLWDLLNGMQDAGEYSLWSPCIPSGEPGSSADPMLYPWGASWSPLGGLEKRLDAIADMLQGQKVLPQPTCKPPRVEGEWVSVNFESSAKSVQGDKRLRKVFRYRDQQSHDLVAHVEHWREFTWQAGDVVVIHKGGVWGVPQVWAASAAEGKRVIRHAAAIAGVDLDAPGSQWIVTGSGDPRYGMAGEMRVRRGHNGLWMISKRNGPSGKPEYLRPA